jgi:murein DD-endopeptidase MepM/ murein hydrolase activator NlpD
VIVAKEANQRRGRCTPRRRISPIIFGTIFVFAGCRGSFNFWGPSISLQQERPVGLAPAAIVITAQDADGISLISVRQKSSSGEKVVLNQVYSSPTKSASEEVYLSVANESLSEAQFILEVTAQDARGRESRKEYAVPFNNEVPSVSVVTAPSLAREGEPVIAVIKSNSENLESAGLLIGSRTVVGIPLRQLGRGGPANLFLATFALASHKEAASVRAFARNAAFNTKSEPITVSFTPILKESRRIRMKSEEINQLISATKSVLRPEASLYAPSAIFSDQGLDSKTPLSSFFGPFLELSRAAINRFLAQKLNSFGYPRKPLLRPAGLLIAPFGSHISVVTDNGEFQLGSMPFEYHETSSSVVDAIGSGTVIFNQNLGPLGTVVGVDSGLGIVLVYGLLEKSSLSPGAQVSTPSIIGTPLRRSGSSYGNYFVGAFLGGVPINPKYLFDEKWFSSHLGDYVGYPN